jgi:hypothetical protein
VLRFENEKVYITGPAGVGALSTQEDSAANPPEPGKGVLFFSKSCTFGHSLFWRHPNSKKRISSPLPNDTVSIQESHHEGNTTVSSKELFLSVISSIRNSEEVIYASA